MQFTQETLKHFFPDEYEELWLEFMKLIVYDALIGNNDRHFYNWAILRNIHGKGKPAFSPIYDTARGLFWNDHEDKVVEFYNNKSRLDSFIQKYSENCNPKIGWEGAKKVNHFQLLEYLKTIPIVINCDLIRNLCSTQTLEKAFALIDTEFQLLLGYERRELIKLCLKYRHERIQKIFNFAS